MLSVEPQVATVPVDGGLLNQMIWGFTVSQGLYVAARLGVVDVLRDGPKSSGEIASAVGANERALHRLLRALTAVDILVEDGGGRFAATPRGRLLASDHPQSVRAVAVCMASPAVWRPWGHLYESIVTGKPAFDHVYGESFFEFLSHNPEPAGVFNAAMTSISSGDLPAILQAYDFSGFQKIVDVGGGEGILLRGILEHYPRATGVLFDLPPVVAEARDQCDSTFDGRYELAGGDMFESVPAGGDCYILKSILHDWSDAEAIQILRNCRRVIASDGKLLVVELIIAPSNQPDFAKWLDLNMLVLLTGRERTEAEFAELYAAAGFRLTRVISTGGRALIEGIPA